MILLFAMDMVGFLWTLHEDTQPPVVFSDQLFWDEDIAEPPRMLPDCGNVPISAFQTFNNTVIPLVPPDTGRIIRFHNNDLELMDSRIDEFSVLSLGVCDPPIDMDTLDGDEQGIAHVTLRCRTVMKSGYASCISPAREYVGQVRCSWIGL